MLMGSSRFLRGEGARGITLCADSVHVVALRKIVSIYYITAILRGERAENWQIETFLKLNARIIVFKKSARHYKTIKRTQYPIFHC